LVYICHVNDVTLSDLVYICHVTLCDLVYICHVTLCECDLVYISLQFVYISLN